MCSAFLPLFVFVAVGESRSACGASGDLSARCYECAELLRNNDNRLNISISNKFACRYSIYHLNLRFSAHSFTSWSPLGCCRRSNPSRKLRYHNIFWAQAIVFLAIAFFVRCDLGAHLRCFMGAGVPPLMGAQSEIALWGGAEKIN